MSPRRCTKNSQQGTWCSALSTIRCSAYSPLPAAAGEIEQDWRDKTGATSIDEYLSGLPYMLKVGSMYSASTKSDELTVIWNQVGDCVKTNS